jgi:hypothetical protein
MEASARKFAKGDDRQRTAERLLKTSALTTIGGQKVMLSHEAASASRPGRTRSAPRAASSSTRKFLENYQVTGADAAELDASGKDVTV